MNSCFPFSLSRQVSWDKRLLRHKIYDRLVAYLENRSACLVPDGYNQLVLQVIKDAPKVLYKRLELSGQEDLAFTCRIVEIPSRLANIFCCKELESSYGRLQLLHTPGFTLCRSMVLLDVDERWRRAGFMLPHYEGGLITGLKVFRRPDDSRPFLLRTRVDGWKEVQ
jgi:hypothetical protein